MCGSIKNIGVKAPAKKTVFRMIVLFVVAAVLAVGLEAVQIATQPPEYTGEEKVISNGKGADLSACTSEGCELKNGKLNTGSGVSTFEYVLSEPVETQKLDISFGKMTKQEGTLKVSFAKAGKDYEPSQTVQTAIPVYSRYVTVELPKTNLGKVRFETDFPVSFSEIYFQEPIVLRETVREPLRVNRIAIMTAVLFCVFLLFNGLHMGTRFIRMCRSVKRGICSDGRQTLIHVITFFGVGAVMFLLMYFIVPGVLAKPMNWMLMLFCIVVALLTACLFTFRKTLAFKPEVFFVIIGLGVGGIFSFVAPKVSETVWDGSYHFDKAQVCSYLGENRHTFQETDYVAVGSWEYDLNELPKREKEMDDRYLEGVSIIDQDELPLNPWAYLQGLGLFVGRALRLPFNLIFCMGRFFGLLFFLLFGYIAIRRLKSGKMILASVLMIPELLFLASNYHYDTGVVIFTALGMSYYFAEWQERHLKLRWFNAMVMVISLVLGCMHKPVYFPLLLLPLFLPGNKFKDKKQRGIFTALIITCIIGLLLYIILPRVGTEYVGDTRGGEDVNPPLQIAGILNDPIRYTKVLLNFLWGYFHPFSSGGYLATYGYLGTADNYLIYLLLLAIVAFTDKNKADIWGSGNYIRKILSLIILFGTVAIVATALYISFTPVGDEGIGGCQARYLIPVIFPAMMLIGSGMIRNRMNRSVYNGILFAVIGFVNFSGMLFGCINLFH